MDGWMDGSKTWLKGLIAQSKKERKSLMWHYTGEVWVNYKGGKSNKLVNTSFKIAIR
jgi:hypothetical protein